jgi:ribosomal protein S18 acetylase RimI-like enzyme
MSDKKSQSRLALKKERLRKVFHHVVDGITEIIYDRSSYIQMRLPVEKITPEFEAELRDKIEHSVVHAKVRVATKEDIEHIKDVYDGAWHSSPMPIREVSKQTFSKLFEEATTIFLIASIDSVDAGFMLLDFEGKKKEFGVIGGLGVLPKFQNKGLGTTLALAAWEYFKKNGAIELRCEVYKDNKIPYAFIKRLGFEEMPSSMMDYGHLMK